MFPPPSAKPRTTTDLRHWLWSRLLCGIFHIHPRAYATGRSVVRSKKTLKNFHSQPENGFATLLAILVILAAGASFALVTLSLATGSSRSALDLEKGKNAQALADLCAELSIEKIKNDPYFTGEENFSFNQGECSYSISSNSQPETIEWQVNAESLASGAVRKVQLALEATIPPEPELPIPVLKSWQEVASF